MLEFVKRAFRGFVEVMLWINLLLFIIVGGVGGYTIGKMISWRSYAPFQGYLVLGVIAGLIGGLIVGLIIDIIWGGFIATILNIDKNLEEIKNNQINHLNPPNDFTPTHKVKLLTDSKGLGLRREPNPLIDSFTSLPDGTEIQHLNTGGKIKLQDKEGLWYEIITKNGMHGWCFSGSLKKL
jgi:hypothetical protein